MGALRMQKKAGLLQDQIKFFNALEEALKQYNYYFLKAGASFYLVPPHIKEDEIKTYSRHPKGVIRLAGCWNWHTNPHKTAWENIQCPMADAPKAYEKPWGETNHTLPRKCSAVAIMKEDGQYHTLHGEKFNFKTKDWDYLNPSVEDVISTII